MTEQDKKLLSVVCKVLDWYPEGPTAEDSANAVAVAILAWGRMSDEAKQAAPENRQTLHAGERNWRPVWGHPDSFVTRT